MTLYLYDRGKFINIYGLLLLLLLRLCIAYFHQARTHLLILKFRAGVVSFLTPQQSPTRNRCPQTISFLEGICWCTLLPLSRTHVLYFLRAYHITSCTHTHTLWHSLDVGLKDPPTHPTPTQPLFQAAKGGPSQSK